MTIRVLYFARLREVLGTDEEAVTVDAAATVATAVEMLRSNARWRAVDDLPLSYAVNEEIVGPDRALSDGDVLALLPPVSGG